MCKGVVVDRTPRERINPAPQIGDIWKMTWDDDPHYPGYYLILDISEGEGYRNATIMDLLNPNCIIEDFLDTYSMMEYDCWQRVG